MKKLKIMKNSKNAEIKISIKVVFIHPELIFLNFFRFFSSDSFALDEFNSFLCSSSSSSISISDDSSPPFWREARKFSDFENNLVTLVSGILRNLSKIKLIDCISVLTLQI